MRINKGIRGLAVLVVVGLAACVHSFQPTTASLGAGGVSPSELSVKPARDVQFVNSDVRPHQIYSNDCQELSSTVIQPGDTYTARVGLGPKTCHFRDVFGPGSSTYSGTIEVAGGILDWAP